MTYNFDPDRWFEIQLRLLEHQVALGEIDEARYRLEREDLDRRFEEMQQRLDGTYTIPSLGNDRHEDEG